jgi:lysyl-tRNA synthetase class 1
MYQSPHKAKRLYFDVIPKNLDEYIIYSSKYNDNDENKYENPLWHIHSGNVNKVQLYNLDFNLLLNLASACNPDDKTILWGFIKKYAPEANESKDLFLDQLISYAINYYNDFIKPYKKYKIPDDKEVTILRRLMEKLNSLPSEAGSETIQNCLYDVSKEFDIENLREFFKSLYEILLGQTQGPRLGSFFELYGINETIN